MVSGDGGCTSVPNNEIYIGGERGRTEEWNPNMAGIRVRILCWVVLDSECMPGILSGYPSLLLGLGKKE